MFSLMNSTQRIVSYEGMLNEKNHTDIFVCGGTVIIDFDPSWVVDHIYKENEHLIYREYSVQCLLRTVDGSSIRRSAILQYD